MICCVPCLTWAQSSFHLAASLRPQGQAVPTSRGVCASPQRERPPHTALHSRSSLLPRLLICLGPTSQSPRVRLWSSPTQTCGRVSLGSLTCNCPLFSVTAYSSRQWLSSLVVTGLQGVTGEAVDFFSLALESRGEAVDWLLLFWVCWFWHLFGNYQCLFSLLVQF